MSKQVKLKHEHYDVVIIGAGMSGLAAAIRLAMFDKRVLLLEKHNAPGGLNSFYRLNGRDYDVGLHALTNYSKKKNKQSPLIRVLRQLRISFDQLDLAEQSYSSVRFPSASLKFSNDMSLLESEIERVFPSRIDAFRHLVQTMPSFDDIDFSTGFISARKTLLEHLQDPLLVEMLMLPVQFYGSPTEDDLDYRSFSVLFRSIYVEGLGRPEEGIRPLLRILTQRFRELGGERHLNTEVSEMIVCEDQVQEIVLKSGQRVKADKVLSCAGYLETMALAKRPVEKIESAKRLSFVETISSLKTDPSDLGIEDTLVFFSRQDESIYRTPEEDVDTSSGVICMPNNYQMQKKLPEGIFRMTALANYEKWKAYSQTDYEHQKAKRFEEMSRIGSEVLGLQYHELLEQIGASDMFTPRTVERFTSHLDGAVYGHPLKRHDASTSIDNLFIIGSDHGMVGIIGTMMSGILIANSKVLQAY